MHRLSIFLWALSVWTLGAGCSSGTKQFKTKGQLTQGSAPLKVDSKAGITVVFTSVPAAEVEKVVSYPASPPNRDDMTFTVPGPAGNGIPPGKYRISIEIMSFAPTADVARINQTFSREATKIEREVKDETLIVLDLSKPEG